MKSASKVTRPDDKRLLVAENGLRKASRSPNDVEVAEIGRHIQFDPAILDTFDVKGFAAIHFDLLVLCAAIQYADQRWKRPIGWQRNLEVTIPVIEHSVWQRPEVSVSLHRTLSRLTGDAWRVLFVKANGRPPIGERQLPLNFGGTKTFAVAYSDGLDSRAVSALSGTEAEALCIRVSGTRQHRMIGESYFAQLPFKVTGFRRNESSFRSRGFQFSAVTAIAAQLASITRIVVPESGQGALGPVLLPLYNVYPDYRNHPTFFRSMEEFIWSVLSFRVRYEQPRLWSTKGETLRAFLELQGKSEAILLDTRSCWQKRRVVNVGVRKQCGLCAACLLRRLSLHAAGVCDDEANYVVSDLSATNPGEALAAVSEEADHHIMLEYGSVGTRHLQQLAELAGKPDEKLQPHAAELAEAAEKPYEETLVNLRTMLQMHAREWQAFLSAQGPSSFLNGWMDGGRYGRS